MTRHAEMERPDEVQEAEFARRCVDIDARIDRYMRLARRAARDGFVFWKFTAPEPHRRPYSRLRERNVFDPTYRPRHMNHRAEGATS